ncbi:MAG: hypothetical protein H8E82_07815 [Candidatus Marinimicrobia bacterium]|nr:hypothetical protein [Candidatus Neomarinimicrobiota bacterium]
MNRNRFYKIFLFLIGFSVLFGKSINPVEKDKKEILIINGKRRTYYQIHGNSLHYEIHGPKRIEIICRRAVPRRDKKEKTFGYKLILDESNPITVQHNENISRGVKSSQHPGHGYTHSGKYFLNIPDGKHTITLEPLEKRSSPVLIRILMERFRKDKGDRKFIESTTEAALKHLKINKKKLRYFELTDKISVEFELTGPRWFEVYSRLAFEDWMANEGSYRLRIIKDGKELGTYFFTTEKSEQSIIVEDKTLVPGKWRSCEVDVKAGKYQYSIELLDKNKKVYIRCLEYEQ